MKLKWHFIESGKINKKVLFKLCRGVEIVYETDDMNFAYQRETAKKASGKKFANSINDFLDDVKASVEAKMEGKPYEYKVVRMDTQSFNKFLKGK
jgi:hypothetical protein